MHTAQLGQLANALDIDCAPNAARAAWGEPVRVAVVVDAPPDAIDPPEAERLVERLLIGDRRFARVFLVEPDQQLGRLVVMRCVPLAELVGGGEIDGVHMRPRASLGAQSAT